MLQQSTTKRRDKMIKENYTLTTIPSTFRLQQNEQHRKIYVEQKDGLKRCRETANNSKQQSLTDFPICNLQHQDHTQATQNFRKRIDALSIMHTCTTCMESYPGIVTHSYSTRHIFHRCQREIIGH